MDIRTNLRYSKEHEWIRLEGNVAYIGITDYAQHEIGDVVFVELPAPGDAIKAGGSIGVIESVKATSDVYTPIAGEVVEVNSALEDQPELINSDPYEAWIAALNIGGGDLSALMDSDAYRAFVEAEG